jgi:asparagine N-glycosylation enzyme membrane subunit Stt3
MKLFIDREKKSILLDDGIRVQYVLYTVLLFLIFVPHLFSLIRDFEGFSLLNILWLITLVAALVLLFFMWFRMSQVNKIGLDEIKHVKSRKYLTGTYVGIRLKSGKVRELSVWLSENQKSVFLTELKEQGIYFT